MNYCVLTFGCRANQADSWVIEGELQAAGGAASPAETADVVVVNTCTVTASADQAARNAIRRIARTNPSARIVATGCYATRAPDAVSRLAAGGIQLVANTDKTRLALEVLPAPPRTLVPGGGRTVPGPGTRGRTAYPLRVQTGCDEHCAYCIVPSTRGRGTSRPLVEVVDEVRRAAAAGFKELWISGVHLGSYGRDQRPAVALVDLMRALDREGSDKELTFRLSSLEPMDCGEDVLAVLASSPCFVPHLHIPLQHASDRMLAAMRRNYDLERFRSVVDAFRSRVPDGAIGTDLIVGFPGETEHDFDEQVDYLRESPVTHVHIFPYSDRPGTAAAAMRGKVPAPVARERAAALRGVGSERHLAFVTRQLGRDRPALTLDDGTTALTDNYLKVGIPAGRARNERVRVRPTTAEPLRGEVVA
jgi:threonylcarbamoyladenosine tRNA methylthiotransferase MtaB